MISQCHGSIEQVHYGGQPLRCVDCHGGDPAARSMVEGHETVLYSFNPSSSALANWWTRSRQQGVIVGPVLEALDEVDPNVIQFLNPADGRAVAETCGSTSLAGGDCHADIAQKSLRSLHTTLAGQISGGLYFHGLTDREPSSAIRALTDPEGGGGLGFAESLDIVSPELVAYPDADDVARAALPVIRQMCVECHTTGDGQRAPGKYTSSGCGACHMLTADDGQPRTMDPTQKADEIGHPIVHRLTNRIPDAQCNHCHHGHVHRGLTAQGVREPSEPEGDGPMGGPNRGIEDPPDAVPWSTDHYVRFAGDFNLYGKPYPFYVEDEDGTNDVDETPPDIHTERGMACIDCHTTGELHGGGHVPMRREFETEVRCETCHGTLAQAIDPDRVPFEQSVSALGGRADNRRVILPDTGEGAAAGDLVQVGKLDGATHPLTQIARRADPDEARYNPRTQMGCLLHAGSAVVRAELAARFEATPPDEIAEAFPGMPDGAELADDVGSRAGRVECYTCHNSWTENCYGCHVVRDDRADGFDQVNGLEEPGRMSTYPMSVLADALALGFDTRGRVSPMVGTSIFFTHIDADGRTLIDAAPLRTVDGFEGDGNQHNPVHHHTVRRVPRPCTGCHPRADGEPDDADALARAVGYGTTRFVFIDGTGRRHLLDRLVGIDFDGDGEADDPETMPLGSRVYEAWPIAASTHLPIDEDAAALGPGPLDRETIGRMLGSRVVPQPPPPQ